MAAHARPFSMNNAASIKLDTSKLIGFKQVKDSDLKVNGLRALVGVVKVGVAKLPPFLV